MRYSHLRLWLEKAEKELGKDWENCDRETGRECRGVRCWVRAHRALVYLNRALEEMNQNDVRTRKGSL